MQIQVSLLVWLISNRHSCGQQIAKRAQRIFSQRKVVAFWSALNFHDCFILVIRNYDADWKDRKCWWLQDQETVCSSSTINFKTQLCDPNGQKEKKCTWILNFHFQCYHCWFQKHTTITDFSLPFNQRRMYKHSLKQLRKTKRSTTASQTGYGSVLSLQQSCLH